MTRYRIGIPIVTHVDLLDVANACEVFRWMPVFWDGHEMDVWLIGHTLDPVVTGNGARLTPDKTFDDLVDTQLDLIFVPGGGSPYLDGALADTKLLDFVKRQAKRAQWVTSVCTGAFILGQCGLLDGRKATTHWLFMDKFRAAFPKAQLVNAWPRYQQDGNVVTGGGLSSAIDETIFLAGQVAGEDVGKRIELTIQYHPSPPYGVGDPGIADFGTYSAVYSRLKPN